jgi:hypothetical protein
MLGLLEYPTNGLRYTGYPLYKTSGMPVIAERIFLALFEEENWSFSSLQRAPIFPLAKYFLAQIICCGRIKRLSCVQRRKTSE